jgi:hypothetical protein
MWEGMWREQAGKGSGIRRCGRGLCSGPEEGGMVSLWIFGYSYWGFKDNGFENLERKEGGAVCRMGYGFGFLGFL